MNLISKTNPQHVFAFEPEHNYAGENFLVASSNKLAFEAALGFPWADYALYIHGEAGCGKTHVAKIAKSLADKELSIIDNPAENFGEVQFLQTLNSARENQRYILITARKAPAELGFTLPDLTSRLAAIPTIAIESPTEELFYMLLARQFAARQIYVDDVVLNFLTTRLERNFTSLIAAVEKIDRLSLQEKRSITIPLVKNIVKNVIG